MPNRFFKKIYKLHVYVGVFVAVHFAIFALSGLVLLFKDEIQGKNSVVSAPLSNSTLASFYEKSLADSAQKFPADRALALYPDDHDPRLLHLRLGENGSRKLRGSRRLSYQADKGEVAAQTASQPGDIFDWVLRLHRELLLGSTGKIYVGLVGLAYVFLLISGFYLYGNFMRTRAFGELRAHLIPRLLDLHKSAAVITFGWSLVVGLSGVFLAFNGVLIKAFQYFSLLHLNIAYANLNKLGAAEASVPLGRVLGAALEGRPNRLVSYVAFPNTEYSVPGHFLLLLNGTEGITKRLSELAVVNASTGRLTEIIELPVYLKVVLLSEPLHFGDYGGLFLKILWAIFSLGSLAVAILGITSFFLKRSQRPRTEYQPVGSRLRFSRERPYLIPLCVAGVSFVALGGSLYFEHSGGALAALLLLPLSLAFLGVKNAKH